MQYQLWQNDEVLKLREVHDQRPVIFMPKMRRERRMAVLAPRRRRTVGENGKNAVLIQLVLHPASHFFHMDEPKTQSSEKVRCGIFHLMPVVNHL